MNQTHVILLFCNLRLLRPALAALGLLALAFLPLAAQEETPDQNDPYHRALAAGKAKLEAGQLADAQKDFQAAVQANDKHYEGYFYLAVAAFRQGDHSAALEFANAALEAAQGDDENRARDLVEAIRDAKEAAELAREADEAQGKGLMSRAADLYARAFHLAPARGDLGLKAATLMAQRLNRLLEAAVILQGVVASGDADAATKAGGELGELHERLEALYQDELPRAVSRKDRLTLIRLAKAFPQEAQPRVELAAFSADDGDSEEVARWLGEAIRLGTGYDAVQARVAFLDLWERDSEAFKSFVRDAFGTPAVDDMDRRLKDRQAKQREEKRIADEKADAAERARKAAQRKKQLAQEQTDRENAARPLRAQLRQAVVSQLQPLFAARPAKEIWRKSSGYYSNVRHSFASSLALQGDSYVIIQKIREEGFGRKNRHGVDDTIWTFTIDSMAGLATQSIDAHWSHDSKNFSGPYKQLRVLRLVFGKGHVSSVKQTFSDSTLVETTKPTQDWAEITFILREPADAERSIALVLELKAIDSLTLEQLREKTGAAP